MRPARKSNHAAAFLRVAGGAARDLHRPERAPLAYEEFRLKEYDRDRDGTWLDDIPDGNDHSIDAVQLRDDGRRAEGLTARLPVWGAA